jgi:hypothetical protein
LNDPYRLVDRDIWIGQYGLKGTGCLVSVRTIQIAKDLRFEINSEGRSRRARFITGKRRKDRDKDTE